MGCEGQLLLRAHMRYFSPQVCFADARDQASGLFIVAKGWIELCLPVKHGGHTLRLLKRGCVQDTHPAVASSWPA